MRWASVIAVLGALAPAASAQDGGELTIYRTTDGDSDEAAAPPGLRVDGHAVVRQRRAVTLEAGVNRIRIDNLPGAIDPGSLWARVGRGGARVRSFRVLGGQRSVVELDSGKTLEGQLAGGGPFAAVMTSGGLRITPRSSVASIRRAGEGGALTLEVVVESDRPGPASIELGYETGEVSWDVAYSAIRRGDTIELSASVELENNSGAAFPGARITLVDRALVPRRVGADDDQVNAVAGRSSIRLSERGLDAGDSERELFAGQPRRPPHVWVIAPADGGRPGRHLRASCMSFARPPISGLVVDMVELALPPAVVKRLVPGAVRVLDRGSNGRLTPAAEGPLEIDRAAGVARFAVGTSGALGVSSRQRSCRIDGDTLREEIELEITNRSDAAGTALVRTAPSRWHHWIVTRESRRGRRWGAGREYRVDIAAGAVVSVRYTAVYH